MTTWRLLTTTWFLEPSILCGCAALLAAYAYLIRPRTVGRSALYTGGVLVLLLSLISPIDTLGDGYLFSAHMLQHLLLVLVTPPLLLLGIPAATWTALLAWPLARRAEAALGRPLAAWTLGLGTLWVWHAPALYDAAVRDQGVHILQHLSFLVTATVFWWPILAPGANQGESMGRGVNQRESIERSEGAGENGRRLSPLGSIAYRWRRSWPAVCSASSLPSPRRVCIRSTCIRSTGWACCRCCARAGACHRRRISKLAEC